MTETIKLSDAIGRHVPDHPDQPISFANKRDNGMWWYGHTGTRGGWATGSWNGRVVVVREATR